MELSVTDSFFFFSLLGQLSFPGMARRLDYAPICLSLEEVTVRAGHKVVVEADDNSALIVGNQQGILGKQLRPLPILEVYFTQQ
jgi:hypothetical protein